MPHTFEPIIKELSYFKVQKAIEDDILSGALGEGASLPTEAELCEQLGVTRSTVREGLRLLEQSGLVRRGPAKRFYVRRPNTSDVAAATSKSLTLGGVSIREVWETLSIVYPQAIRLATKRIDAAQIDELWTINKCLQKSRDDDFESIVNLEVSLLQTIAQNLDNKVLLATLQSLNLLIGASLKYVISRTPNARSRIVKAQKKIISAIEKGDEDKAALWFTRHINDLKKGYIIAKVDLEERVI